MTALYFFLAYQVSREQLVGRAMVASQLYSVNHFLFVLYVIASLNQMVQGV